MTKMWGYRELPISFKNIWKVGSVISDESGNGKCEIIDIVNIKDLDKAKIEEYNKCHLLKVFCKDRPSLSSSVKKMKDFCKQPQFERGLNSFNIEVDDVNFRNIANSFTVINVNVKKISTKIIKLTKYNALSYSYISKYIEEDIENIEVILSIVDSQYNVSLENREIILFKNDKEYTLEILHSISFSDILNRLPKYMALKRKYKDVYIENKTTPPVSKNKSEVKLENVVTDLDEVIKTTLIADTSLEEIEQKLNKYWNEEASLEKANTVDLDELEKNLQDHWREEAIKNNRVEHNGKTASNSLKNLEQKLQEHWRKKAIKNDAIDPNVRTASNSLEDLEQKLQEHWQGEEEEELTKSDSRKTTNIHDFVKLQQQLKKHWEEKESEEVVQEKASDTKINTTRNLFTEIDKGLNADSKSIFNIVDEKLNNYELFHEKDAEIIICSNKIYDKNIYLTIDEIESQLRVKRNIVRNKRDKFLLTLQEGLKIVDTLNEDLYLKYEIDSNTNFIEIQDYNLELINKKNNTNFSKEFATCILAANMNNDFVLLGKVDDVMRLEKLRVTNRHLWNNLYLIRKTIAEKFKFVDFVEDVFNRVSKYGFQSYSLYFNGYISNFLIEENITLLKLVFPIAEKIINDEFDLDINEHDEITFEKRY